MKASLAKVSQPLHKRGYVYSNQKGREIEILPDSGAQMNLADENLVTELRLPTSNLPKPMRVGSINDPDAFITRRTVTVSFRMGRNRYTTNFFVAPIGKEPSLVVGVPWMEEFHPEIIQALKDLGENPQKHSFHGGG